MSEVYVWNALTFSNNILKIYSSCLLCLIHPHITALAKRNSILFYTEHQKSSLCPTVSPTHLFTCYPPPHSSIHMHAPQRLCPCVPTYTCDARLMQKGYQDLAMPCNNLVTVKISLHTAGQCADLWHIHRCVFSTYLWYLLSLWVQEWEAVYLVSGLNWVHVGSCWGL